MSSAQNGDTGSHAEADLAQAFKELQRGEQTAAALEAHLDSIEKKIEALLAQAEKAEMELKDSKADDKQPSKADENAS
ncbi:hypothetical protein COCMIDRAFT_40261 [Bipolaris oryzae ATCC 44560]|uniref:Uncharacterized protein n=1 Tax=Bipolaris oryzae ATCC 44560 TaxID=930090 RepID=W6ZCU9_COCMI|nr:uncharacterized protein COCMIDRAFT_40261 [Bipolaris oryzae ATCC 44560]EUC41566.1 hypothetical protein COCMIDRAFT_40261 [Bipolaris oryzae ATCC 44560]